MELWTRIRNSIIGWKYKYFLKPILFLFDPEDIHDLFIKIGNILGQYRISRWLTNIFFNYTNPKLEQTILGLKFKNPIGLAAGFDKNAQMLEIMPSVGFSFSEVGSVTGRYCSGNAKPRLWRLPKSKSLIVYYGLKNNGAEDISEKLSRKKFKLITGVSLAKTNDEKTVETEAGIADYISAYQNFLEKEVGDYYTINISCPNAYGGEPFIKTERLERLLSSFANKRKEFDTQKTKPIFLKMPPDLSDEQLDSILTLAYRYQINGFVCTNLTKDKNNIYKDNKLKEKLPTDKGGLSGKIVEEESNRQIKYLYQKIKQYNNENPELGNLIIIGCGGIFNAEDAYKKIKAGASLLQLITGMIFEGPQVVSEINQGLVGLLQKDGYKNISEAIGKNNQR